MLRVLSLGLEVQGVGFSFGVWGLGFRQAPFPDNNPHSFPKKEPSFWGFLKIGLMRMRRRRLESDWRDSPSSFGGAEVVENSL